MELFDQLKISEAVPPDLLSLIRRSGILSDRQFEEVSGKVRSGEYPSRNACAWPSVWFPRGC